MIFWKKWRVKSELEAQLQQYLPMLERIVASYESRHALQQELLQDVIVAIWQAAERFSGESSWKTYMARIAQNRCVTHVDKSVKQLDVYTLDDSISHPSESMSKSIEQQQQWRQLMGQVRQLPIAQKQVLSLMLEGFSYKEIADICGLSESNVGVLISRAKSTLQEQLGIQ